MSNISHIGFNIKPVVIPKGLNEDYIHSPQENQLLELEMLVNGEVLRAGAVFDGVRLIVHGAVDGYLDPFTCSCGNAGCVDIHEEVVLRVDETRGLMHWRFPETAFRTVFKAPRWPAEQPLQLTFDLGQYEAALADLETRLAHAFASSSQPTVVLPSWECENHNAVSFPDLITKARAWHEDYMEGRQAREEAEKPLRPFAVRGTLPEGDEVVAELTSVAWAAVSAMDDWDDQLEAIETVVSTELLANPSAFLQKMSPSQLREAFLLPTELSLGTWATGSFEVIPSPTYRPMEEFV